MKYSKNLYVFAFLLLKTVLFSQDDDLDLDAMWDNTVWNEIEEVTTKEYEVEKVTAVAGVRGAEAEDEALHHLYYRQSMKGPSEIELNKALGKLLNTLSALKEKTPDHEKIPEVTPNMPMRDALLEMSSKGFGYAVVVENKKVAGVISDGDLRRHIDDLMEKTVEEIATKKPITVSPDMFASEALSNY